MSDSVISVENLSKRYVIGHESRHDNLRDTLHHTARKLWRRFRWGTGFQTEEFWALRDVSFEVKQGEVVGIIGRNGAGKSTLLKILSRITEPTAGKVRVRGRVASLLEVGTGFHPELSGRENIFLNGAILGMTRPEIRRKFDEIVAFAEVERFLDTPVKHYSSGMYVRLAFAVAAHLDPEILIIDEVLSVGDTQFQKKCLGKMQDIAQRSGRTVLFVSHDLSAITTLTSRALLLDRGKLFFAGDTSSAVAAYFGQQERCASYLAPAFAATPITRIEEMHVRTSECNGVQAAGAPLSFEFVLRHEQGIRQACFSFQIINQYRQPATHAWLYHTEAKFADGPGYTRLICLMPKVHLNVGCYTIRAFLAEPPGGQMLDTVEGACAFEVARLGKTVLWGWRADLCVYHEEYTWKIVPQ